MLKLQNLTATTFEPFGQLIVADPENTDEFQVIVREKEAEGWQIALSRKTRGPVAELGRHPNTRESFEPISGVTVLLVAETDSPQRIEAFLLDKPVCLYKNIWHATMALTGTSLLKITENYSVESHQYKLPFPLDIGVVQMKTNGGNI